MLSCVDLGRLLMKMV